MTVFGPNFASPRRPGGGRRRLVSGAVQVAGTFALLAATLAAAPAPANEADIVAGRAIAIHGVAPGRAGCAACHMPDGAGQPEVGIPRLAGLRFAYMVDQLSYFASGHRTNAAMAPYAKMLTATQRRQAAAYFASLPIPAPTDLTPYDEAELQTGKRLFLDGEFRTGLLACADCHGPEGQGVGDFSPRLAGQSAAYLSEELAAWKAGGSRDPSGAFMRVEASHLSDADIAAVAAFLASLHNAKDARP